MEMNAPLCTLSILDTGQRVDQIRVVVVATISILLYHLMQVGRFCKWLQRVSQLLPCPFRLRQDHFQGRAELYLTNFDTDGLETLEYVNWFFISDRYMTRIDANPNMFEQERAGLRPGNAHRL